MKKIGFVDYYLDEWHANNYPQWIRESSLKNEFEIAYAWAEKDLEGGMSTNTWCEKFGVKRAESLEELIALCDCFIILSPDHPEKHEELSRLAAKSKKPVYVDKTFAPNLATAKRIFENFENGGTPLFSSSALRFAQEFETLKEKGILAGTVKSLSTRGPGTMARYGVHQVEMMVALMGTGIKRVMECGPKEAKHFVFDYHDGRRAQMTMIDGLPFQLAVHGETASYLSHELKSVFFPRLIESMLHFFLEPNKNPVSKMETLEIMAAIEASVAALSKPDEWVIL